MTMQRYRDLTWKGGIVFSTGLGQLGQGKIGARLQSGISQCHGCQFLACSPDPGACLPASAWAGIGDKQLATQSALAGHNALG